MRPPRQSAPPRIRAAHRRMRASAVSASVTRSAPAIRARPPLLFLNGLGANIELALPFIDALSDADRSSSSTCRASGGSPTPSSPYRPSAHRAARGRAARSSRLRRGRRARRFVGRRDRAAVRVPASVALPPAGPRGDVARRADGSRRARRCCVKMVTPRRYLDAAHAHRVAGDIYGGAFRRDPRARRAARFATSAFRAAAATTCSSPPHSAGPACRGCPLLRQPTLIMAGADDPLVPLANARIMRWLIPDARLEIVDCGHLFLVTRAAESARIVESFLTEPARGARQRAASHRHRIASSSRRTS